MERPEFERLYAVELAMARRYEKVARAIREACVRHFRAGRVETARRVYQRAESYVDRTERIYERLEGYACQYQAEGEGESRGVQSVQEVPGDVSAHAGVLAGEADGQRRNAGGVPGVSPAAKPRAAGAVRGDAQYNPFA